MGGEDQIKLLIRQAFAEKNVSDRAVLDVDALLGRVMRNVRRLVETLPEESLLRATAWSELERLIKIEMAPYAQGLQQAVLQQEVAASPEMKEYARRQAEAAGAKLNQGLGAPTPASVVAQVERAVVGKTRFKQLFTSKNGTAPWTKQMFNVVNRRVQAGIIQGMTTQQIAQEVVHETISRGVPGVSLQYQTSTRQIRAQAMAMTRTVTADVSRQIREELYAANADAMEGMVYQFSSALDSITCPTCAVLDGERYDTEAEAPVTPIHPNCRCKVIAIDPEDPFWDEQRRNGQQISREKYATGYKTKVKVKGEYFYRKAVPFQGDSFSDYLASSNLTTQAEFFGGGAAGQRRARYFRNQLDKLNKDPRQILVEMLNGPANAKKFIPIP